MTLLNEPRYVLRYALPMALLLAQAAAPRTERALPVDRVPWLEETKCLEMFSAMTVGPEIGISPTVDPIIEVGPNDTAV